MDPRSTFWDLTPYFVYLLLVATFGPLLFGYHLAELNAPEDVIRCKAKSIHTNAAGIPQCLPTSSAQWGLISSIFTLGGLIGALTAGSTVARNGRLRTMQVNTVFFVIGPILEAISPNIAVMSIGRFISGLGAGAAMVAVPLYISEIAPPVERGLFGAFSQVMVNFGILLTQLLGYFLSKGQLWRIILAAGGAIGVAQAVGLIFAVESPKWMALNGRSSEAKRNLCKIRGDKHDISEETETWEADNDSAEEDAEHAGLLGNGRDSNTSTRERKENLNVFQVFRHPAHRQGVFAVMMVMLAQQLTGVNSIVMYGVSLLSKLLSSNSALLNLVVSAVNIIMTGVAAPLIDKLGRKTCILMSIATMGVSALLLAVGILKSIGVLSAIAVLTFIAGFGLGLGPVPFILSSELVDAEAVGATQSLALASNWIATFVVAQFFPIANDALGGKVYFIFAALAAFFFVFVSWYVPESKGKKTADEVWGRDTRRVD